MTILSNYFFLSIIKKCRTVKGSLNKVADFKFPTCLKGVSRDFEVKESMLGEDGILECVDRFC